MTTATATAFDAVQIIGGLIPPEQVDRVVTGIDIDGMKADDYHVIGRRSIADEAERHWEDLKAAWKILREELPEGDQPSDSRGIAQRAWIEPLFNALGFGRLTPLLGGIHADDGQKLFPVTHQWSHVPILVADWGTGLDERRTGAPAPHSVMQECLNRSQAHLWGIATNGRSIRLLRDSNAIAGTAYIEFDLATMFDTELVNEFILLYKLLHVSRFEVGPDAAPSACWLEKWRTTAIQSGVRALEQMKQGVKVAIKTFGTGFLQHPDNGHLIEGLDPERYHRALLRLTYRLLFLFVAEDRGALHPAEADPKAVERYRKYYSTGRLRLHSLRRSGTTHGDLYKGLRLVLDSLGEEGGQPLLAVPGLGGIFDPTEADEILDGLELSNEYLLQAVRALARVKDKESRRRRAVDYRHLGAEELGSVYESLLELVPKYSKAYRSFELVNLAGNQRKTTGSYYTPANLIERLLDTTLNPVIEDAVKRGQERGGADAGAAIEEELLGLTVCDPACGSGHFLVAAARRIAKRLAATRERTPEPTPGGMQSALRDVIGRCIYGVDLNPMAVELAKVALWMEALQPGKPLSFLDAHIKCGNALVGAFPALMEKGVPDKAWGPIEGDNPKFAAQLEKRNALERLEREQRIEGAEGLFALTETTPVSNTKLADELVKIIDAPADDLAQVHAKEAAFRAWSSSEHVTRARALADTWCAAFFWPKHKDAPLAPTDAVFKELKRGDVDTLTDSVVAGHAGELRERYRFFHWYLEFPEVFRVPESAELVQTDALTGWAGGFDCVVGNPPWDKVEFEDMKYFGVVAPEIAEVAGRARKQRIAEWEAANPENRARYRAAIRDVKGRFRFASGSGVFPLCQRGLTAPGVNSLNTDQLFAELFRNLGASRSRLGAIIPSNIATGAGAQYLFADITQQGSLISLFDFTNMKLIFRGVHPDTNFCLLTLRATAPGEGQATFAFGLDAVGQVDDTDRTYSLSVEDLALISPNTLTVPIFRASRDVRITTEIYSRVPVFWNETEKGGNFWGVKFKNLFNTTDSSDLYVHSDGLAQAQWSKEGKVYANDGSGFLPVMEGKMVHLYDAHWGRFTGRGNNDLQPPLSRERVNPDIKVVPRYWISSSDIRMSVSGSDEDITVIQGVKSRILKEQWDRGWLYGLRDVTNATNERTAIPCVIPISASVETFPLMFLRQGLGCIAGLVAAQSSFVFDYVSRLRIGDKHMKLFLWKQLPVPHPDSLEPFVSFIARRVLELVYTAYDMRPFAEDLEDAGEPFVWDEDRRFVLRAELDALFFHIYGIGRDDADYIMETFPIVKKKDLERFGTYRTKDLILDLYDQMATAGISAEVPPVDGENFTSSLDSPPGQGLRHPRR
jgi:hypothetical protein